MASPCPIAPSPDPKAFARYQLDGEIHVDELKGALVMCYLAFLLSNLEHVHPVLEQGWKLRRPPVILELQDLYAISG